MHTRQSQLTRTPRRIGRIRGDPAYPAERDARGRRYSHGPSRKGRKYRECHREDYAKGAIRPSCRAFAFQSFVARASAAAHELNSVMSIANVPLEYVRPQRVVKSHVEEAESCICTSGFFTGERPGLNFRV